jgi:hypothetical protein
MTSLNNKLNLFWTEGYSVIHDLLLAPYTNQIIPHGSSIFYLILGTTAHTCVLVPSTHIKSNIHLLKPNRQKSVPRFTANTGIRTRGLVDRLWNDLELCIVRQHRIDLIWPEPAWCGLCLQLLIVQIWSPPTAAAYISKNSTKCY